MRKAKKRGVRVDLDSILPPYDERRPNTRRVNIALVTSGIVFATYKNSGKLTYSSFEEKKDSVSVKNSLPVVHSAVCNVCPLRSSDNHRQSIRT